MGRWPIAKGTRERGSSLKEFRCEAAFWPFRDLHREEAIRHLISFEFQHGVDYSLSLFVTKLRIEWQREDLFGDIFGHRD